MPYQPVFLVGIGSCSIFRVRLTRLKHVIDSDKHGVSHRDNGRPSADARR